MVNIRPARWPADRDAILALDLSFTTDRVYRVAADADAFALRAESVSPPLRKTYKVQADVEDWIAIDTCLVAELDGRVAGVAALAHDREDDRALLQALYVDFAYRRQGAGRALVNAMIERGKQLGARCLWLETQDVNHPAIQFYQRMGFAWCGLDLSLDDRNGSSNDETAVFFSLQL